MYSKVLYLRGEYMISLGEKEAIRNMRKQGNSYGAIAKVLGIGKDQVKSFCKRNGLNGFTKKDNSTPEKAFDIFKTNLHNKTNGELVYMSGYTSCDSKVLLRFKDCGHEITKSAQFVRRKAKLNRCMECFGRKISKKEIAPQKCEICKKEIEGRTGRKTCSDKCKTEYTLSRRFKPKLVECNNESCSNEFFTEFGSFSKMYCSISCRDEEKKRKRKVVKYNRKKRIRAAFVERVVPNEIYKRDKYICQLCYKPLMMNKKVPHHEAPTVDHVIPIAKGGTHEPNNVQAAHFMCNSLKGDRCYEESNGQLRIF